MPRCASVTLCLANNMCLGTAWPVSMPWKQSYAPSGVAAVWIQLVLACLCPLCLRPRGLTWLSQNNFSMRLMTFWGQCYCSFAVRRAAGSVRELGTITHLWDWCSQPSVLHTDGLSAGFPFQAPSAGTEARVGGDVPCVADCNCFKRREEMQLYNREEFREVLDVPEGL